MLIDQAVSIKDDNTSPDCRRYVEFTWPRAGEAFNRDHMVTWNPGAQPITIALTFAVFLRQSPKSVTISSREDDEDSESQSEQGRDGDTEEGDQESAYGTDPEEEADEENGENESRKRAVYWPATVILPKTQKRRSTTIRQNEDEIIRLRHLLTTDRTVWIPIQSSSLLKDRDRSGLPLQLAQEADVVEEDASIQGEGMGKKRKRGNERF